MPTRIAILASGSGSNAEQLMRHFADSVVGEVAVVISDRKQAGVHGRAQTAGIPSVFVGKARRERPGGLLGVLREHDVDLVVLAGYLRLIPADVLAGFPERVINIHPALLPNHGGPGMYGAHVHRAVKAAGDTVSGITIHLANEVYDEGKVLFQASTPIQPEDSPEVIARRVLALEHRHYPLVVEAYIQDALDAS